MKALTSAQKQHGKEIKLELAEVAISTAIKNHVKEVGITSMRSILANEFRSYAGPGEVQIILDKIFSAMNLPNTKAQVEADLARIARELARQAGRRLLTLNDFLKPLFGDNWALCPPTVANKKRYKRCVTNKEYDKAQDDYVAEFGFHPCSKEYIERVLPSYAKALEL